MVKKYGGGKLPSYDKKYDAGTNPGKWGAPASTGGTGGGASSGGNSAPAPQAPQGQGELDLPPEIRRGLADLDDFLNQLR